MLDGVAAAFPNGGCAYARGWMYILASSAGKQFLKMYNSYTFWKVKLARIVETKDQKRSTKLSHLRE